MRFWREGTETLFLSFLYTNQTEVYEIVENWSHSIPNTTAVMSLRLSWGALLKKSHVGYVMSRHSPSRYHLSGRCQVRNVSWLRLADLILKDHTHKVTVHVYSPGMACLLIHRGASVTLNALVNAAVRMEVSVVQTLLTLSNNVPTDNLGGLGIPRYAMPLMSRLLLFRTKERTRFREINKC